MDVVAGEESRFIADSHEPSELITELLHVAGYLRLRQAEFLERFDLTEGRFAVLSALYIAGDQGLSQADVADHLMQSESNVSSLIDRLQGQQLVDRRWSSTDRRKRIVLLTEAGQALVQKVETARRSWAQRLFEGLNVRDCSILSEQLRRLPGGQGAHIVKLPEAPTIPIESQATPEPAWQALKVHGGEDASSPQVALEQMLVTLGLARRFAGEAQ